MTFKRENRDTQRELPDTQKELLIFKLLLFKGFSL